MTYYAIRFNGTNTFAKAIARQTLTKGQTHTLRRVSLKHASLWTNKSDAQIVFHGSRLDLELVKIHIDIETLKEPK